MSKDFQKQFMASATGIWYTQKDFDNAVEDAKAEIIATAMQTAKYAVDMERKECAKVAEDMGHKDVADAIINRVENLKKNASSSLIEKV